MRAAKWKLDEAKKRIKSTMQWRREFQPDLIPPEDIRVESETGKMYSTFFFFSKKFGSTETDSYRSILNGFDKDGRPIIWMTPAKENTPSSTRQLRHLVFVL
jgi:hypothetical protein